MQNTSHLQNELLCTLMRDKLRVTVFLMNGFQLRGVVCGFDAFTMILDSEGKQQIIYKHAISTLVPERPLPFEAG